MSGRFLDDWGTFQRPISARNTHQALQPICPSVLHHRYYGRQTTLTEKQHDDPRQAYQTTSNHLESPHRTRGPQSLQKKGRDSHPLSHVAGIAARCTLQVIPLCRNRLDIQHREKMHWPFFFFCHNNRDGPSMFAEYLLSAGHEKGQAILHYRVATYQNVRKMTWT